MKNTPGKNSNNGNMNFIAENDIAEARNNRDDLLQKIKAEPKQLLHRWNLSLAQLALGEYKEGWENYEVRWEYYPEMTMRCIRYAQPYWRGENIKGKKILLWGEQGIGDGLQFARYAEVLKRAGAEKVYFESMLSVRNLFEQCKHVEVCNYGQPPGDFDYQASVMSLPCMLGRMGYASDPADLNMEVPYLFPKITTDVLDFIDLDLNYKVGVCWAGDSNHPNDSARSCPLSIFRIFNQLLGVRLFSLQVNPTVARHWQGHEVFLMDQRCVGMHITDLSRHLWAGYFYDFNLTAQAIAKMDVIITVDTSIAHLAGAMGKKTYLLLGKPYDWRWLPAGNDKTPWYPHMTLCRWRGNWERTIEPAYKAVAMR